MSVIATSSMLMHGYERFSAHMTLITQLYAEESETPIHTDDGDDDILRAKMESRRAFEASYCTYLFGMLCCCFEKQKWRQKYRKIQNAREKLFREQDI